MNYPDKQGCKRQTILIDLFSADKQLLHQLSQAAYFFELEVTHSYISMVSVYKGYPCGGLGSGHYNLGNLAGTAIGDESKL